MGRQSRRTAHFTPPQDVNITPRGSTPLLGISWRRAAADSALPCPSAAAARSRSFARSSKHHQAAVVAAAALGRCRRLPPPLLPATGLPRHAMADQAGGEGKKPLGRAVESLGWLASSGVQPKRRREIEGAACSGEVAWPPLRPCFAVEPCCTVVALQLAHAHNLRCTPLLVCRRGSSQPRRTAGAAAAQHPADLCSPLAAPLLLPSWRHCTAVGCMSKALLKQGSVGRHAQRVASCAVPNGS